MLQKKKRRRISKKIQLLFLQKRYKLTVWSFIQHISAKMLLELYKIRGKCCKKEKKGEFQTEFNCYSCKRDISLLCRVLYSIFLHRYFER